MVLIAFINYSKVTDFRDYGFILYYYSVIKFHEKVKISYNLTVFDLFNGSIPKEKSRNGGV